MSKKIFYIIILFIFFIYGFAFGFYKIFPFNQIMSIKHYLEQSFGNNEISLSDSKPEDVVVIKTFLHTLLAKQIYIGEEFIHGGGISETGSVLYAMSSKGKLLALDTSGYFSYETTVADVPMNYRNLILSGHTTKNRFRTYWFRVNGFYSERITDTLHTLYVSHNAWDDNKNCITHNISKTSLTLNNTFIKQANDWNTIFTASPCIEPEPEKWLAAVPYSGHISGGKIIEYDQNHLLISVGDYNYHGLNGTGEYAMDPSNPYGKFIILDKESGAWEIFATGTRNPSGLFKDKEGNIWSSENGPFGGDELNLVNKGLNYGWPRVSYGLWYDTGYSLAESDLPGAHNKYEKPVFSWVPSVAPSNLIRIEGQKFQNWNGDLLMGTMRDQCLYRIRLDQNLAVAYTERIDIGQRIRDIKLLHDDKIVFTTDSGFLFIIDDGGSVTKKDSVGMKNTIEDLNKFDQWVNQNKSIGLEPLQRPAMNAGLIYEKHCSSCHNLNPVNAIGPHLHNLFDREIGSLDNYTYSVVLESDNRKWNPRLLKDFLLNPEFEFRGINMLKIELTNPEADSLVQFIESN